MLGESVGRYRVTEKIGAGGMGEIYAAVHELMGREAVVKVLLPQIAINEKLVKRFFEEARAAAKIQNPGIVEVFDSGWTEDGRAYLVMEKLDGETLKEYLKRCGKLLVDDACTLICQLARVMEAAHKHGIVHRDLKPDNIFIVTDAEVPGGRRIKVLDFGLAKINERKGSFATMTGTVFGTPAYMAPEQCRDAANVDHRADLYAIGCIFYRCLCGRPPFNEGGSLEVMAAQLRDTPTSPQQREPSVPDSIDAIIMQLLDKHPDRRISSCREFVEALDNRATRGRTQVGNIPAGPRDITIQENYQTIHAPWSDQDGSGDPPDAAQRIPAAVVALPPAQMEKAPVAPGADTEGSFMRGATNSHGGVKRNTRTMVIATALIALGLLGSWIVMKTEDKGPRGNVVAAESLSSEEPAEGALGISTEQQRAGEKFDLLLEEAQDALVDEAWGQALDKVLLTFDLGLPDPDRRERANELKQIALSELQNEAIFERLRKAVQEENIESIADYYRQIPDDSTYKVQSTPAYVKITRNWLDERARKAHDLSRKNECAELNTLAAEVTRLFPGQTDLETLAQECTDEQKAALSVKGDRKTRKPPRSSRSPEDKELDKLMRASILSEEAKQSIKKNLYGQAIMQCQKALKIHPPLAHARMLCAMAACKSKNRELATYHYAKLTGSYKKAILQVCMGKGIHLNAPASKAELQPPAANDKRR